MSLKHIALILAASTVVPACGPHVGDADWMLDTFSEAAVGYANLNGLSKYTFEAGGEGTRTSIGACGGDESQISFRWERRSDRSIAIVPGEGEQHVFNSNDDERRLSLTGRCVAPDAEEARFESIQGGQVAKEWTLVRGDVCIEVPTCPEHTECDCVTVWCDEPPSPCNGR